MIRVLTLSTLFPDVNRPTFGPFVERQTLGLAAHPDVQLKIVSPRGLPPWPLSRLSRYAPLATVPDREIWKGIEVFRPAFLHIPGTQGRFDAGNLAKSLLPLLCSIRKDFPFDIIDAEFFFPDGPAAITLGKAFDVPVSIKARGADIQYWGAQGPTSAQVRDAGQSADGLLAVADALKGDMIKIGMPGDKIKVHYTGVDLSLFRAGERSAAKAELGIAGPMVLSVGALIPRKRQSLTMRTVATMPGVQLAFIGKGEDLVALRQEAQALGIADRVRFLGALPHADIARWLAAADVMCLPSSSEGLANAWVEALACGTPVVTTNVGGARELMDRPEAGRIVEPETEAIATAISELLAANYDPFAVRKTAERFTWEANRDALYAHLRGLVEAH
jgi:teichuronic acid biosynthesis glycosyltransferase TuaC